MAHFDAQYMEFAGCPKKAASLETITIRPCRWARNVGSSTRVSSSTPKKFVSITRRTSDWGRSSNAPPTATPALCTTASSLLPVRVSVAVTAAWIELGSVTSSRSISTWPRTPAASNECSSGPDFSKFRIVATTRQPRAASATAVAQPMPLEAPVIKTLDIRLAPLCLRRR